MDKLITTSTTDQTHDFMNVDSFSQLPFIRPAPATNKDKSSAASSASGIRLFGIDFSSSSTATENSDSGDSSHNNNNNNVETKDTNVNNNGENGESGRKFECHYCCRNFPTSQALGGHQNAHKRERQHAKRAHLQSAMMAADPHHQHLYNLVNYPHHQRSSTNSFYPTSFSSTNRYSYNPTSSLYHTSSPSNFGQHSHHHRPTINGSPLAMWRIPATTHSHHHHHHLASGAHRDRSLHPLPLFAGTASSALLNIDSSASKTSMSMGMNMGMTSSQSQIGRRSSSDHVSLDLHL